jgi:hypothetical protein
MQTAEAIDDQGWMRARIEQMSPNRWTLIASRPRAADRALIWAQVPRAPLDICEAHQCQEAGLLILSNRHNDSTIELLARPSRAVTG